MSHPFKNPNFRTYLIARLFGALGSYMMEVALMWWALEATGQNDSVAWVALTMSVVGTLASPFGGVLADRANKVGLASVGYALSMVAPAAAAALLLSGHLSFGLVMAIVAIDNLISSFFAPANNALGPLLLTTEQYSQGAAMTQGMSKLLRMASMPLGGLLVAGLGVAATLLVTVSVYLVAASMVRFVEEPRAGHAVSDSGRGSEQDTASGYGAVEAEARMSLREQWIDPMVATVRMLFSVPLLAAALFMVGLLNFILSPIGVMMAPYAKSLGGGAEGYGLLLAGITAGELLGYAIFTTFRSSRSLPFIFGGSLVMGLSIGALAWAANLLPAIIALGLAGFGAVAVGVHLDALAIKVIPKEFMGRALSMIGVLLNGLGPLGLVAAGIALRTLSFSTIFITISGFLVVASLLWLWPSIARAVRAAELVLETGDAAETAAAKTA
ncbi:MFS transporter [Oceanithermus desulfurans]|uniref:MFS transporter n=2 Tax=Oceanithermus desulfurans TaxID=227924 RepID=A0A511RIT4_9DEIN|nr:MFS transporter [Oceanithermus desulfurans]MBB6029750.1 MFS family permease [Oceanithermus desulfurans]GEM89553.1 MFS transporter [Oceanithermus desulfurans NBRC 100063]